MGTHRLSISDPCMWVTPILPFLHLHVSAEAAGAVAGAAAGGADAVYYLGASHGCCDLVPSWLRFALQWWSFATAS